MEINYLTAAVENNLSRIRNDKPVDIGKLKIAWSATAQEFVFTATDVNFMDNQGNSLGLADSAEFGIIPGNLIRGELSITRAVLNGGYLEVEQEALNIWRVADLPITIPSSGKTAQSLDELRLLVNAISPRLLDFGRRLQSEIALEKIEVRNAQIHVSFLSGANFVFDDISMGLENVSDVFSGSLSTAITNQGRPVLEADWEISRNFNQADARIAIQGPDWSKYVPYLELIPDNQSRLDLSLVLTREKGLISVDAETEIARGNITIPGTTPILEFSSAKGWLSFDVENDTLGIRDLEIHTNQFDGVVSGEIGSVLLDDGDLKYRLKINDFNAKFWRLYDKKAYFPEAEARGAVTLATQNIHMDEFAVQTPNYVIRGSGRVKPRKKNDAKDPPFEISLDAHISEIVTVQQLKDYWPVILAPAAREWVFDNVISGFARDIEIRMNISPDTVDNGVLEEGTLDLSFVTQDLETTFVDDLPPITGVDGQLVLKDNSLEILLSSGAFAGWRLDDGSVRFPQLNPPGADMYIEVAGAGPIQPLYQALSESRLDLDTMTQISANRISGRAQGKLSIIRPNMPLEEPDAIRFNITGQIRDAGLLNVIDQYDIKNARADVEIDRDGMTMEGFGYFEGFGAEFGLRSEFDGVTGTKLSAKGILKPSEIAQMGVPVRAWLSGNMYHEIQGQILPSGASDWRVEADLAELGIDLPWVKWSKLIDRPGALSGDLRVNESGEIHLIGDIIAERAKAGFDLSLDTQLRLIAGKIRNFKIPERADLSIDIVRNSKEAVKLDVAGAYLNIEDIFAPDSVLYGSSSFAIPDVEIVISAQLDRLELRDGLYLQGYESGFLAKDGIWQRVDLSGQPNGEGSLTLQFTDFPQAKPTIDLKTDNAGFALDIGLLYRSIAQGSLSVSGTLYDALDETPGRIELLITDSKLVDMPALTHILTLGSLRGIADTLGGDGILFSRISAPITLLKDRIVVTEGRANGPALGVTAQGWMNFDGGIRFDGVLVPSYGANTALKAVPLIGDLVVGRSGEGIFSIGYYVRGTLDKAQITVNPLSALTPGVLRRIFEAPNDSHVESVLKDNSLSIDPVPQ